MTSNQDIVTVRKVDPAQLKDITVTSQSFLWGRKNHNHQNLKKEHYTQPIARVVTSSLKVAIFIYLLKVFSVFI